MPTPAKKPAKKYGPGEYKSDIEYKRIEDLPKAKVIKENRNETQRPCPSCGQGAKREHVYQRQLHDVGDLVSVLAVRFAQLCDLLSERRDWLLTPSGSTDQIEWRKLLVVCGSISFYFSFEPDSLFA